MGNRALITHNLCRGCRVVLRRRSDSNLNTYGSKRGEHTRPMTNQKVKLGLGVAVATYERDELIT